jgi:hypothetical protein
MKQFATWFTHGVPGGARLRAAIYHARTGAEVLGQVEEFFAASTSEPSNGDAPEAGEEEIRGFPEGALVCD